MKKLIFLLVLLTTASYGADYHSPYDPGAARKNLGNVTPATGRAALGLGTMAVATSTDYVATDTFTAHTSATGTAVHGLGTMAAEAATDYVATSALALRLDTVNASFTGDIDVTGDVGAATVNGVAPLTAAEKTQALAEKVYSFNLGASIAAGASVTVTITKATTSASVPAFEVKYCKTDDYGKPIYLTRRFVGNLAADGTATVLASDSSQIGVGQYSDTPLIEWLNGTDGSELKIRTTATGGETDYPQGFVVQIIGGF